MCYDVDAGDIISSLAANESLQCRLSDLIQPDYGLLECLLRLQVLSPRQVDYVRSQTTVYGRNDALLDLLTTECQSDRFLEALQQTGQQHVANLITHKGGKIISAHPFLRLVA